MSDFKLAKGITVPDLSGIMESYSIEDDIIIANVSFENLNKLIIDFINQLKPPMFFILEVPTSKDEELNIGNGKIESLHRDLYYMDGCTTEGALAMIIRYGELLLNDGLLKFGFASHETNDEIFVEKYKIINIYSRNITEYKTFMEEHNIPYVSKTKTVWENFTQSTPGRCEAITVKGKQTIDIIKDFDSCGLYFAKRIDE